MDRKLRDGKYVRCIPQNKTIIVKITRLHSSGGTDGGEGVKGIRYVESILNLSSRDKMQMARVIMYIEPRSVLK